jgi:hypothetical protein
MPALAVVSSMMDAVMNELRIPVTNTTERTKIQAQMAYVYSDICAKQDWWWLVKQSGIRTPFFSTEAAWASWGPTAVPITVTVSRGSTTVTFLQPALGDFLNFTLFVDADNTTGRPGMDTSIATTPLRVTNNLTGTTTGTLEAPYGGETQAGATFVAYGDMIALPADCAKLLRLDRWGGRSHVPQRIGIEDMAYLKTRDRRVGPPEWYTIYDFSTSGDASTTRMLWVHPYPDKTYTLNAWYKHQSAGDLSDIALPTDYQQVLNYGTLSRCYPIFLNDLERGQYYLSLFNDVMALMANQQREYASDKAGISPSADLYRTTSRRWRGRGSLGTLFDTWPSVP